MTPVSGRGASIRPLTELEVRPLGRWRRFFARNPVASDVLVMLVVGVLNALPVIGWISVGIATGPPEESGNWAPSIDAGRFLQIEVVAAVLGVAVLWFRRREPVIVLALVAAIGIFTIILPGRYGEPAGDSGLPFAIYAVAASRRPMVTWASFGGVFLAYLVATIVVPEGMWPDDGWLFGPFLTSELTMLGWVLVSGLVALAIGISIFGQRSHVAELVRRSAELVEVSEQNIRMASMQERSKIAREMHDVVAHSLSVMIALADGARAAAAKSPDQAAQALDLLAETGRDALTDMRRMLGVLRDGETPMSPQPTAADDLTSLADAFRHAGLVVHLDEQELPPHPGLKLAVFRLVQESLTNVLRHAPDAKTVDVRVHLVEAGSRVEVFVRNDGGPPAEIRKGGKGLVGMQERAAMYAGGVTSGPSPTGWQVHAVLTIPPPDPSTLGWVRPV